MSLVQNVLDLLSTSPAPTGNQVSQALSVVTNIAKAYVRSVGFENGEPNDEIASVIVTATARLLRNPGQLAVREEMGPIVVDYHGGFAGWSIAERETLNRYRMQAV
ncbi:hypothetical protein KXD96_22810 [Mycobacterium sp. SMC-2]|uniref:hypothetical protein n=1 Tax=Mycobacterium sp. SMC-2 TaxID=2857058 RepID=UPI0021B29440|nr:hypothetical protein [Mycobacterium sp. SMC-2]UXA05708.1 hypothetical protein KXD96_22810 [Mycobacterium sp. SMC-2]